MKKLYYLAALAVAIVPALTYAHGGLVEADDSHTGQTMMGDILGDVNQEGDQKTIEPCEVGSVVKCGDHGEGSSQTLDAVINDILVGFKVNSVADLDCEKIIDHDFEHVGEALMSYMHPNEAEHGQIDDMMGGEGSEALDNMHRFMGKRYLGCDADSFGPMMMFGQDGSVMGLQGGMMGVTGMMGLPFAGMFGGQSGFFTSMMGSNNYWGYGVLHLIMWVLAIVGIIWLINLISKKK